MKYFPNKIIITAAVFLTAISASAQTPEEKARALMTKFTPSLVVVTVNGNIVTTTTSTPLPPKEQKRVTLGITISDSGLVVVSNSSIDSSVGLENQKVQLEDKVSTISTAKTEFSDIEISYGDGMVLHGKLLKQDVASDLAFIMPDAAEAKKWNKKFEFVDLAQSAPTAEAPDPVVGLSRASSAFGFMPTLVLGHITGVYKDDHTFFVNTAGSTQGMPIFTLDGKFLGLTVIRIIEGQPTGIFATLAASSIQVLANLPVGG